MIKGSITTKDILTHPLMVISVFGMRNFLRLLLKSISVSPHFFIEILYK